ncbi:MAG: oligomeric, coiled-coil, peripheral membrane protein [Vezdaea acicularis]|nr:MAG: oligomeric, coiled-coil, peripheral membrane protein [Vezdaea acicularis]
MTARGKQVKLQSLLTEQNIFVFDRQLALGPKSGSATSAVPQTPLPPDFRAKPPPDILSSHTDLQAWQTLFKSRRGWASNLEEENMAMLNNIRRQVSETGNLERALNVAMLNLKMHIASLEATYKDAHNWAGGVLKDQEANTSGWEGSFSKLGRIVVRRDILDFCYERGLKSTNKPHQKAAGPQYNQELTLQDFFDSREVKQAASASGSLAQEFGNKIAEIDSIVNKIFESSDELTERVNLGLTAPTQETGEAAERLIEEVQVLSKKVSSDYDHVASLDDRSAKSVPQASKMALLHTKNFLVLLQEHSAEMSDLVQEAISRKNSAIATAVQYLRTIGAIESMLSTVNPQLASLDLGEDASALLELLGLIPAMPLLYGSVLVESVRRREWANKLKSDSSTLAEELSVLKDEEERRRKRWSRNTGVLLWQDQSEDESLNVEVNLKGDGHPWPTVEREEVDSYINVLNKQSGLESAAKEVKQMLKDLDKPTKQQVKRAKAFKMGSIHEANLGRSSLLLRGDDELHSSLRSENSKLTDKLKGSESRIRKLEDLLHRQSAMSRQASGNIFQASALQAEHLGMHSGPYTPVAQSPLVPDALSRRSSVSSRRFSANQGPEEKALAKRIVTLEAELNSEREKAKGLQKEALERRESEDEIKTRIEEANSTKKDLMDNLDAQQREFIDERRLLHQAMDKLKAQIEEAEDDLERIEGSRENEKSDVEQKLRAAKAEIKESAAKASEDMHKAQSLIESLQKQLDSGFNNLEQIDEQRRRAAEENQTLKARVLDLEARVQQSENKDSDHIRGLRAAHTQLAPSQATPEGISALIGGVEALSLKSANYGKSLENALAMARADKDALETTMHEVEADAAAAKEKLGAEEMESFTLRETLAEERGHATALRSEVEDQRLALSKLRSQISDGETGSKALQERLSEQELVNASVMEDLGVKDAQVKFLESELHKHQGMLEAARDSHAQLSKHHESRGLKAIELSQKLHSHNERLARLLESLGFAILFQDGVMTVQRASKVASASASEADLSSTLRRSTPGLGITREAAPGDSVDLGLLHWTSSIAAADGSDSSEDEKYAAFIAHTARFDLFTDVLAKRMKETEYVARRWQKEARAYRDKAHRSAGEAHEKIAYRSFKEGDLALFLPTRNQAQKAWAAFNVGAPHYFLREQEGHKLKSREWLLARISGIEPRVVDLKKSMAADATATGNADRRSIAESTDDGASFIDDENPFDLSDGLRWYLIDALEEKPGAPTTPGLGKSKSTVASAKVDATGSIRIQKNPSAAAAGASKALTQSLDSRRSSTNSRKGALLHPVGSGSALSSETHRQREHAPHESPAVETVRELDLGLNLDTSPASPPPHHGQRTEQVDPVVVPTSDTADGLARLSATASPPPQLQKGRSTLWDSMWRLEASLERGKS